MFLSRNKKNTVYPCIPQFYYIKVGLRGSKLYRYVFVMLWALSQVINLRICFEEAFAFSSDLSIGLCSLIWIFIFSIYGAFCMMRQVLLPQNDDIDKTFCDTLLSNWPTLHLVQLIYGVHSRQDGTKYTHVKGVWYIWWFIRYFQQR